jgi:GDP-mannose 6-dehydrogenase
MNISVFGLGYVGTVACGCLAKQGNRIIGVDVSRVKVDMINAGHSPVIEPEIDELITLGVQNGWLRATQDSDDAILNSDVTFISVGTPSQMNGSIDLRYVKMVCEQIGTALKKKPSYHVVVARSTMLPGSMRNVVIPTLERFSGKRAGSHFGVCFNPEFLREGTSVLDFFNPPKTVIGADDEPPATIVREIYQELPAETFVTSIEVSEMVKYADNNFHAVKVTFANEIGAICKSLGIDSHEVMDIFCRDKKLNISPYYLRPGFAFGGSCLPKDVNALLYQSKLMDLEVPLLRSLLESNEEQIQRAAARIIGFDRKNIGFLGFSFKAGTDDLRGSPMVTLVEMLLGKGYRVRLYDKNVSTARLMGANQSYIEQHIPHIAALMCGSPAEVVAQSDLIVVGNKAEEFTDVVESIPSSKIIVDLVRVKNRKRSGNNYFGIAW